MDLREFQNLVGCEMTDKLFYGTKLKVTTKNEQSLVTCTCEHVMSRFLVTYTSRNEGHNLA
nr:hypothetical protein [Tanacetum cinerariifolium]